VPGSEFLTGAFTHLVPQFWEIAPKVRLVGEKISANARQWHFEDRGGKELEEARQKNQ
jgi:hypothetical protein